MSKRCMFSLGLVVALALLIAVPVGGSEPNPGQPVIPRIEKMPSLPAPYKVRDWKQDRTLERLGILTLSARAAEMLGLDGLSHALDRAASAADARTLEGLLSIWQVGSVN